MPARTTMGWPSQVGWFESESEQVIHYHEADPWLSRKIQTCNDIEMNPGPKSQQIVPVDQPQQAGLDKVSGGGVVDNVEAQLEDVRSLVNRLDASVASLLDTIESMRPAYQHALKMLNASNSSSGEQKNNLVFYGVEPEPLEKQMAAEPEFCRDILETRIKYIFRQALKISRDIPFNHVYRFTTASPDPDEIRPIIAGFRSIRDKENILRHCTSSKVLRQMGITVTEDFSSKRRNVVGAAEGDAGGGASASATTTTTNPESPLKQKVLPAASPTKKRNLAPSSSPVKRGHKKAGAAEVRQDPHQLSSSSSTTSSVSVVARRRLRAAPAPEFDDDGSSSPSKEMGPGADLEGLGGGLAGGSSLSDRLSSCNSEYAGSSNSGSSGDNFYADGLS